MWSGEGSERKCLIMINKGQADFLFWRIRKMPQIHRFLLISTMSHSNDGVRNKATDSQIQEEIYCEWISLSINQFFGSINCLF